MEFKKSFKVTNNLEKIIKRIQERTRHNDWASRSFLLERVDEIKKVINIINKSFKIMEEDKWIKATHGLYNDPRDCSNNKSCVLCSNEAEDFDDHCEEHQPCIVCNEREDCDCNEVSNCCEATLTEDKRCSRCKEHASSVLEEYTEDNNIELEKVKEIHRSLYDIEYIRKQLIEDIKKL